MPTELQQMAMTQVLDGIDAYTEYIEHYGIQGKSGRYPLGSGDRPYQDDRFASRRAKKAYDKAKVKADKKRAKEKELAAKEKAEKEAKEKKAAEKLAENRKTILQDPGKLSKHMNDEEYKFTNEEIKSAMDKFNWQKNLNDLSNAKLNAAKQKMDSILGIGKSAISFYNLAAGVKNSIDRDSKLPIIKFDKDNREDLDKKAKQEKVDADNAKLRAANLKKAESETKKNEAAAAKDVAEAERIRAQRLNEQRESIARADATRSETAMNELLKNIEWVKQTSEARMLRDEEEKKRKKK